MNGKLWVIQMVFILSSIVHAVAGEPFSASVVKIIDGDSLVVAIDRKKIEVRLYGVDCPEYDQPFSREAKKLARKNVFGKEVVIEPAYHDSYGRLVAVVVHGEKVLNKDLVQAGLAWVSPRYCKKAFCGSWKKIESVAQKEKRGLWQNAHPDPPWQWKRMKRATSGP